MVTCYKFKLLVESFVWFCNSKHLSVNASVSRDIRTRGMLEDVVVTQMNRRMDVFIRSMFVCSRDARSG